VKTHAQVFQNFTSFVEHFLALKSTFKPVIHRFQLIANRSTPTFNKYARWWLCWRLQIYM